MDFSSLIGPMMQSVGQGMGLQMVSNAQLLAAPLQNLQTTPLLNLARNPMLFQEGGRYNPYNPVPYTNRRLNRIVNKIGAAQMNGRGRRANRLINRYNRVALRQYAPEFDKSYSQYGNTGVPISRHQIPTSGPYDAVRDPYTGLWTVSYPGEKQFNANKNIAEPDVPAVPETDVLGVLYMPEENSTPLLRSQGFVNSSPFTDNELIQLNNASDDTLNRMIDMWKNASTPEDKLFAKEKIEAIRRILADRAGKAYYAESKKCGGKMKKKKLIKKKLEGGEVSTNRPFDLYKIK